MKTVLVADDEPMVTAIIASQLSEAGYLAQTAADGQSALDFIEKNHPDLVILDIFMPRLSGAEVLVSMREHDETRGTPIIVLSGISCRCKGDGGGAGDLYAPDSSISKPWNPDELLAAVRRLIGLQ